MSTVEGIREPQPGEIWEDKLWAKNTLTIIGRRGQRLTVRYSDRPRDIRTLLVQTVLGNYRPRA